MKMLNGYKIGFCSAGAIIITFICQVNHSGMSRNYLYYFETEFRYKSVIIVSHCFEDKLETTSYARPQFFEKKKICSEKPFDYKCKQFTIK